MNQANQQMAIDVALTKRLQLHHATPDGCAEKPALLFIHGWASTSAIWQSLFESMRAKYNIYALDLPGCGINAQIEVDNPQELLQLYEQNIVPRLPARYSVVGWSLGGIVATLIADRFSQNVSALFTIATNGNYVANDSWPDAMKPEIFEGFCQRFRSSPEKTIHKFALLQAKGAVDARYLVPKLRESCVELQEDCSESCKELFNGLEWLRDVSLLDYWRKLKMPVFHSYGELDELVPIAVVKRLQREYPNHKTSCYGDSSHLPFISEQDKWLADFNEDLDRVLSAGDGQERVVVERAQIDKHAVQCAFSRAAHRYDSLANLQRRVAKDLLARDSSCLINTTGFVLDLGAGTGFVGSQLADITGKTAGNLVQLDLSAHMLAKAKSNNGYECCVQADMDCLPFADESFELILSSLSIQWSKNTQNMLDACFRLLKPGGKMLFSTVLPGSLKEIALAWQAIDQAGHVHEFCRSESLNQMVGLSGFSISNWDLREYRQAFATPRELLASVSGIGAGNHRSDRSTGLLGRQRFQRLLQEIAAQEDESGSVSLTYEILFAELHKPFTGQGH